MVKDMTEGRPLPLVLRFALPMLAGALFQQLYNVVDMFVVGNVVGSRALAAIGDLIWLYNNTLRSMGDMLIPFLSGLTELVFKVGLSILLSRIFGYVGIWFAMPIGWVLGIIPSVVRFHTGGWRKLSDRFVKAVDNP